MNIYRSKLNITKFFKSKKVYKAEMQACNNFPNIYGFIDKSVFAIVLQTWSKTDNPPRPRRKEDRIMLYDRCFSGRLQIIFKPFVNSKMPEMKPVVNFSGICRKLNIGLNKFVRTFKSWLFCRIEIITENKTTNPPINKIVLMEFVMLFPITPPKFDREILS